MSDKITDELLPCPFCGKKEVEALRRDLAALTRSAAQERAYREGWSAGYSAAHNAIRNKG